MTKKFDIRLITMFNAAPLADDTNRRTFDEVNMESSKYGYIVHPDCCTSDVLEWIEKEAKTNYNATFYKEWADITSKTRFELLADQMRHYASTYGTNYSNGQGYVPNDTPDIFIPYEKFKVIMPVTKKELFDRIVDMFSSGIALDSETVKILSDFVSYHIKNDGLEFDIDRVKNKEVQVKLCDELNITPSDPFALLRYLVYKGTGKLMLIKDKPTIKALKENTHKIDLVSLTGEQRIALASIFYRFKPLFLAMKSKVMKDCYTNEAFVQAAKKLGVNIHKRESNSAVVNELRRLAKVHHKPFKPGFWETVLCEQKKLDDARARLDAGEITNFKKITLMQGILAKLQKCNGNIYVIRNGRVWVDKDYKPKSNMTSYLMSLYGILEQSVVDSIKDKAGIVVIPRNVNFTVPTSEKNFVGNYPFGTSVDLSDTDNVIGIYWRNEWKTRDFDLHMYTLDGKAFGWNASYYDDIKNTSVIYSGDMTNADPEATELFYFRKSVDTGKVQVCQYNGETKSQFKLFVATEDITDKLPSMSGRRTSGTIMCNPNNVKAEFMIPVDNERTKECALITDNRIYLMDLTSGNNIVPDHRFNNIYLEQQQIKCRSFIGLNDLLVKAGFTLVDSIPESPDGKTAEIVLDLTNPAKDSLIKLFS